MEYKSFFKTVNGNEGNKCHYPTRLDTYGCGCGFNCDYCYAKSLLDFRGLWHPQNPSVADIDKIRGFKEITVCEDETEAYNYWRDHFNPNPDDCCNLRCKNG